MTVKVDNVDGIEWSVWMWMKSRGPQKGWFEFEVEVLWL